MAFAHENYDGELADFQLDLQNLTELEILSSDLGK